MATITIPGQQLSTPLQAPIAPSALQNPQIQNMSIYRAMRSLVEIATQDQTIQLPPGQTNFSFGSVATYASDGTPATFNQGDLDGILIRVFAAGSPLGPLQWYTGGNATPIPHTLNRIPIGYWVVRNELGAMIYDGGIAWTATEIYLNTTHSNSDIILWIF
jgi:hypothetical protein